MTFEPAEWFGPEAHSQDQIDGLLGEVAEAPLWGSGAEVRWPGCSQSNSHPRLPSEPALGPRPDPSAIAGRTAVVGGVNLPTTLQLAVE